MKGDQDKFKLFNKRKSGKRGNVKKQNCFWRCFDVIFMDTFSPPTHFVCSDKKYGKNGTRPLDFFPTFYLIIISLKKFGWSKQYNFFEPYFFLLKRK